MEETDYSVDLASRVEMLRAAYFAGVGSNACG